MSTYHQSVSEDHHWADESAPVVTWRVVYMSKGDLMVKELVVVVLAVDECFGEGFAPEKLSQVRSFAC